jgi:hypothetical protein
MRVWRRWWQRRLIRLGKKVDRLQHGHRLPQWFLLAGRCEHAALSSPEPWRLSPLYPPAHAFWADPFAWSREGRRYVFFEEYSYAMGRGHIGVLELDPGLRPLGEAATVLAEPHHLSYPFLFEVSGELYMLPEKAKTNRLDLYRCAAFPHRWEFVRSLLTGMAIADATLFEHEGYWWLFGSVRDRRQGLDWVESLFAFYAKEPLHDTWTPHPGNPLLRDYRRGRPAGRVLRDSAGRLLRPSQDCVRRYGHGLNLSEITVLSPTSYRENLIWRMSGREAGGWRGMHHLDWHDGLLVMDAQRWRP